MAPVLVVDDAAGFNVIRRVLEPRGYDLKRVEGFAPTCALWRDHAFDLALIDLGLGTRASPEIGLRALREGRPAYPTVVLGEARHLEHLTAAVAAGARDYLIKPVTSERLLAAVGAALASPGDAAVGRLIGSSLAMQRLRAQLRAIAARDARVLIVGPTGSGKDLVARAIHELSARRQGPFVAVNCATMQRDLADSTLFGHERGAFTGATTQRRGMFDLAHRGTIFLDEVEELLPETQAKLLRVVEDQRFRRVGGDEEVAVDARIVAASNQDLRSRVASGHFRDDLFHRLNVVTVAVPPLSQHRDDIPELVDHFLRCCDAPRSHLTSRALHQLQGLNWPGNVRELRNAIERSLIFKPSGELDIADMLGAEEEQLAPADPSVTEAVRTLQVAFAGAVRGGAPPRDLFASVERALAETAVRLTDGNKTAAGRLLQMERKALDRRLKRGATLARG